MNAREARVLGGSEGMPPPGKLRFSGLLKSSLKLYQSAFDK